MMASSNSNKMEVDRQVGGETDWYQINEENITSNAVELQTRLSKLKLEIIQAMARNKVEKTNNRVVDLDDGELFGEEASRVTDQLHQITKERTQTFLNFSSLNAAKKAAQCNQAIIKALNLENGGKIDLEEEEEEYLRSLLDDQKELIKEVVEQHKEGVNQDIEIIKTRIKLAELYFRYSANFDLLVRSALGRAIFVLFLDTRSSRGKLSRSERPALRSRGRRRQPGSTMNSRTETEGSTRCGS